MVIKNTTNCTKNLYRQAAIMCNNKNESYRKKKLIYNLAGLVSGMVGVSIMSRQLLSSGDYNIVIILPFLAVCGFCLFMGMYYLDKNTCDKVINGYTQKNISSFDYEIDAEEILIKASGKECIYRWTDIKNWTEDVHNFYLFTEESENELVYGDCIIIDKHGFTECGANDMKMLCKAVMYERKSVGN